MLSLSFVTGTEPGKWFRRFEKFTDHGGLAAQGSDDALAHVLAGTTLGLVRLPDPRLNDALLEDCHLVELYEETPGIAVPKDSIYAEVGQALRAEDVTDEHVNYQIGSDGFLDMAALRSALQVVAANVGIALAPQPVLKVLSKKQVVPLEYIPAAGESIPRTRIALVWRKDDDCDQIQDFVGIAKGRRAGSSRQAAPKGSEKKTVNKPVNKTVKKAVKKTTARGGRRATKPQKFSRGRKRR